jgi:hypothetical protein
MAGFREKICASAGDDMSRFSWRWLSLREPYDALARNPSVFESVVSFYKHRSSPMTIVDLGCGCGAAVRALALRLPAEQRWLLFDKDRDLLACAARMAFAGVRIEPIALDLGRELEAALETPIDLITCFALLDLVSEDWLGQFASMAVARGFPIYAALTYDGSVTMSPADAFDRSIIQAVHRHQLNDKGFGPALGPRSVPRAQARFEALGYSVIRGASDWMLAPTDQDIQMELLFGWAAAANDQGLAPEDVANWLDRRRELVAAGRSTIQVGHIDFFACQTGTREPERSKSNNTSSSNG